MLISIPKALREKIGEEAAESLIDLLNSSFQSARIDIIALITEDFKRHLAEEMSALRKEFYLLRAEFHDELAQQKIDRENGMAQFKAEVQEQFAQQKIDRENGMAQLRAEFHNSISEVKETIHKNQTAGIRWMFIFWVGQIGALLGFLYLFFLQSST